MNLWMINHHALTPDMSGGTRHYDFAKELVQRGHQVTIIAASFHYAKFEEMKVYEENQNYLEENIDGINFIWFKTPSYKGNGFGRVKNMLSFMLSVIKVVPKLNLGKPDTILGSSVHLFAVYAAYKLSLRYKARFVMEVRDLWPQTLIDMGISKWHPFILLLGWLEKFLYKKADKVITNLPYAYKYIEQFTSREKIVWISNGSDLSKFDDSYIQKLDSDKFNVVYTGTHGLANNLEVLIDVVKLLQDNNKIYFTLLGDGPSKQSLIQIAKNYNLQNIQFLPSVAKEDVKNYLKSADLLYVGLKDLTIYRYGMSMNKVFDYLASKKPILFVSAIENNIIDEAQAGKVITEDDVNKIAEEIEKFSLMSKDDLDRFCYNGYDFLKKYYDIKILVDKLEKVL